MQCLECALGNVRDNSIYRSPDMQLVRMFDKVQRRIFRQRNFPTELNCEFRNRTRFALRARQLA